MNTRFEEAKIEVIEFDEEDIIVTSGEIETDEDLFLSELRGVE